MNGNLQNGKTRNLEKPFPGCLGRMVNLFDFSAGVAANRLLTDKPHRDCDGIPLSRSQSCVERMSPVGGQIEDKVIVSELRRTSNRKSNGTPIKMLIAQEMSKEMETKHNPPSIVAKLMGLDALPQQQPDSPLQRSHSRGYSRSNSGTPLGYWQQDHGFLDTEMREVHWCPEQNEYKDVYEVWQQSQNGRNNETTNKKKMALVRQKFVEAKRLATDEKLRQSKQFQDAVEVLSSNKDLFLKFLQEPNSLFSQHLYDLQSIPPPPETKRITVLKPSKMLDINKFAGSGKNNEEQIKKASHVGDVIGWDDPGLSPANGRIDDNPTQPTRIVVLKPSPGKLHDIKAVLSPPSSSPRILNAEEFYGKPEDDEARESREMAKEITRHMRDNLSGHRRDETLLSSVFSNGYIGDESSFNKSENEYAVGNLSDSEVMSPTSRHSWDYINRCGSPYSSCSFSRASYSPESSVCREAKKRLSERWAMMASNGSCQEQRHVRRSSSTLGEMLALSDAKKSVRSEEEGSNNEQEPRGSTLCVTAPLTKDERVDSSPRNLLRSKSVPVSSTVYETRVNVEVSDLVVDKTDEAKEVTKDKSVKSSFKGKVSSLFFSRIKKSSKEKSSTFQFKDKSQKSFGMSVHSPGKLSAVNDSELEVGFSPGLHSDLTGMGSKQGVISHEAGLLVTKPIAENQDQPSPISVLEPPSEEDDSTTLESSCNIESDQQGAKLLGNPAQSNLIDKSPPIESVARTLSWDDSCVATTTSYPLKSSLASQGAREDEQELLFHVQTLLSAAGLDGDVQYESLFLRWHSPESPLDLSLRDKYVDLHGRETMHDTKRMQYVFDCVNEALVDITRYGSNTSLRAMPYGRVHNRQSNGASPTMVDLVWAQLENWFAREVSCVSGDGGDSNSLGVERPVSKEAVGKGWVEHWQFSERLVSKEVMGKGWVEHMRLEMDTVENEIGGEAAGRACPRGCD